MSNNESTKSNLFFLWLHRSLGLVAVLSVLLTHEMGEGVKFDPFWLRLGVAGFLLVMVAASFLPREKVPKIPMPLLWTCLLLTLFWAVLNFSNDFSRWYFFGYYATLTCCAIILYDLRAYLLFFSVNLVANISLVPLLETPEFKVFGFFASFVAVLGLSFLGLISGIRKRKESTAIENLLLTINQASFEETKSAILVTDADGVPIQFNDAYLETWQVKKEQLLGTDAEKWLALADELFLDPSIPRDSMAAIRENPRLVIDNVVELTDGRFLQRVSRPMLRGEQFLGRIWFYNDITDLKLEEARLEKAREQLARQNEMMIELARSETILGGKLEDAYEKIVESIIEILEVESAGIWIFKDNGTALECQYAQVGNQPKMPAKNRITIGEHSEYFAKMMTNRVVSGNSLVNPGWSALDAPIRKQGRLVGMVCVGRPGLDYEWDQTTVSLINSMSDLLAVTMATVQRRAAEKALHSTNAIQKAIFDLSGLGILVTTRDRKIISYNELYLEMWNLDKAFLEEEPAEIVVGYCQAQLSNADHLRESLRFLVENPDQDQFDFLEFHDGRIMERFTSVLDIDGDIQGRVWFFRDISDRIDTEQRLRATERRNKAILNSLPDLMLRINASGRILDFKVPEKEIFPQVNPDIIEKPLREVFPSEFVLRTLEQINESRQTGENSAFEIEINLTGQVRDYEARLVPSNPDELLLIVRDVTERKRAEKELVQRNYELDSFVYRASHDLKAPLNSLMGLIDIVKNETDDGNVLSYVGLMDKSVVKLDTFIRNLTDFSRINRLEIQYEKVDFEQMVAEITESLRYMDKADRVEKSVVLESGPPLYADSFHIGIVLGNLISNAIKYQDLQKPKPVVEVSVKVNEKEAEIVVSDNGVGIPLEYQGRIFELFFRASNQSFGSGLGLYITRNAVEKMAGKIAFESSPETGTRFTVTIPNRLQQAVQVQVSEN